MIIVSDGISVDIFLWGNSRGSNRAAFNVIYFELLCTTFEHVHLSGAGIRERTIIIPDNTKSTFMDKFGSHLSIVYGTLTIIERSDFIGG